jgi:hypothetical protein
MDPIGLHIRFRSRQAGSFGMSPIGRMLEWLTQTWLRFTCLLISGLVAGIILFAEMPFPDKLGLIVLSPLMALVYWYVLLGLLLLSRHLGRFGRILSYFVVIYFFFFSRVVVQPPPMVDLPLA